MCLKTLRKEAKKQNKVLDVAKYEGQLKNAKTKEEQIEVSKSIKNLVLHQEIVYPSKANADGFGILAVQGDTRMVYNTYYGGQTQFAGHSSSLGDTIFDALAIVTGWSHPIIGNVMSVLSLFIPANEYTNYTGEILRTLYDFRFNEKIIERYQFDPASSTYRWYPMATSQTKESNAQINLVVYKNGVRLTPSNKDLGLVKIEVGNYYFDEITLTSLGKNTLSPLFYSYNTGPVYTYNYDYKFQY